jgi:hypothetical protein
LALTTQLRLLVNRALSHAGLKIDSLTSDRREKQRLTRLRERGYFDAPAFPLPAAIKNMDANAVFECIAAHQSRFDDFWDPSRNATGFVADNDYFPSPDAEVLYCIVRMYEPATIVEIGCGHSTRVSRLAILDANISTKLITIDPSPRSDVVKFSDLNHACPVEEMEKPTPFSTLRANDVLFIDSSHELRAGNDLVHLYLEVIPSLAPGVLIHIHDIFLPYDYPCDWMLYRQMNFAEQYLVQALLAAGNQFEVLWAGHYIQRSHAEFGAHFPDTRTRAAQSLWLRKVA